MKRILAIVLFFAFAIISNVVFAESDFLHLADDYLHRVVDFTGKESVNPSASGYDPSLCIISFDFTDGNQTIVAIDGNECTVSFFFDDNELMSALFQMITYFDEIEGQLEGGKSLQYELRFSDTEIHHISKQTIEQYYTWL